MKTLILLSLLLIVSCGKKAPNRQVKVNSPIFSRPTCRYPNVGRLNYKCIKSGGGLQYNFKCYSRTEICSLNFGKYLNTWRCTPKIGEE